MPGLVAEDVARPSAVDVEACRDEQLDRARSTLGRGPGHQASALVFLGDDLGGRLAYGLGVGGEDCGDEGVVGRSPRRAGAEVAELVGELTVAVEQRQLDRRVPLGRGSSVNRLTTSTPCSARRGTRWR